MTLKRRFRFSLLFITTVIAALIYVDYRLLLDSPLELQRQTERLLEQYLGEFQPEFDTIEISDRVRLLKLTLHKPNSKEVLLTAESAELQFGLPDFQNLIGLKSVTVKKLFIHTDFNSSFDLDTPAHQKPDAGKLRELFKTIESICAKIPAEVALNIQDSKAQLYDTHMKKSYVVTVHSVLAKLRSGFRRSGLSIFTKAQFDVGLLVKNTHPDYSKGRPEPGTPSNTKLLTLIHNVRFDIERRADGILRTLIRCEQVHAYQALGEAMPQWPKKKIWHELNPEGHLKAEVTLDYVDSKIDYVVNLWPQGMSCTLNEFRYRITDIYGKFWIKDQVITWDRVLGKTRGQGTISGRGSVYLGAPDEAVIVHTETEFFNLPLEAEIEAAIRAADQDAYEVFRTFQPTGEVTGLLTLTSTEIEGAAPSLALRINDFAGKLNATYREAPVPLKNLRGSFRLMEGGGVEFDKITFEIADGGHAVASGKLLRDQLIHVDIQTKDVQITPKRLTQLPTKVQKSIAPIRPLSGRADVRVIVKKSEPSGPIILDVGLRMNSLVIKPEAFPRPLVLNGTTTVQFHVPDATKDDEAGNPEVKVQIDVSAHSQDQSIQGATVSGLLKLAATRKDQTEARLQSDLAIFIKHLDLNDVLLSALPQQASKAVAQFSPKGQVKNLAIQFRDLDDLEFSAEGQTLSLAFQDFPVRVRPKFFTLKIQGREMKIARGLGEFEHGGRFQISGAVLRPPENLHKNLTFLETVVVDLTVSLKDIAIHETLIQAFPADLQQTLLKIQPQGRFDALLSLSAAPVMGHHQMEPLITGQIQLFDASASILGLLKKKARFSEERFTNISGMIDLNPNSVQFSGIQGQFLSSQVSASGVIRRDSNNPLLEPIAPSNSEPEQAFQVSLEKFNLNQKAYKNVPMAVREVLADYRPRGFVNLQLSLVKASADEDFAIHARLEPQAMKAEPKILGARLENITGLIEVEAERPVLIDLSGELEGAPFTVRRSSFEERGGPADSLRLFTHLTQFDFRKEAIARLPTPLKRFIETLGIQGTMNATNVFQLWHDEHKSALWLSELVPQELRMTAGVTFEQINGAIHLAGQLQPKPDFRGGFLLRKVSTFKQPITNLKGFLKYRNGQFVLTELLGQIYGGRVTGYAQFAEKNNSFLGTINLSDLSFAQTLEGLHALNPPDENAELPETATTGRLFAELKFSGDAQEARAYGRLRIKNSNLIAVPLVLSLTRMLRDQGKNVSKFDRIELNFRLGGDKFFQYVDISPDSFLRSGLIDLSISGRVWIAGPKKGKIRLQVTPADMTDDIQTVSWLTRLLKSQLVSLRATGTLSDPRVSYVVVSRFWDVLEQGANLLTPDDTSSEELQSKKSKDQSSSK